MTDYEKAVALTGNNRIVGVEARVILKSARREIATAVLAAIVGSAELGVPDDEEIAKDCSMAADYADALMEELSK